MKKGLLVLSIMAFSFAMFSTSSEADARSRASWKSRACSYIEKAEIRAWNRFDQNKQWSVDRVQRRVNLQDRLDCQPNGTIVEQLSERGQFSTLAFALTEAGLVDTLNGEGNFTVFAPTDQAFAQLGDALNDVVANPTLLTDVLTYHVLDTSLGQVPSDVAITLDGQSVPMLNGESISIELRGGELFINDSQVIVTDLVTTNGTVHVIDTVLLPSALSN